MKGWRNVGGRREQPRWSRWAGKHSTLQTFALSSLSPGHESFIYCGKKVFTQRNPILLAEENPQDQQTKE
ncbi:hypothetical protein RRG08_026234 [Elysia crispata]|uniref:Uncharacterized protein n=1 Tax=Elysia crispata TaxID=231223 RepID=A0AAE1DDU4_9GAST|nr:hypothetical protein RRG08_026234 [Elysia crispata]